MAIKIIRKLDQLEDPAIRRLYLVLFGSAHLISGWDARDFYLMAACKDINSVLSAESLRFLKISDLSVGTVFGEQALAEDRAR